MRRGDRDAQIIQGSQPAQTPRDGAAEQVVGEVTAHASRMTELSREQDCKGEQGTHSQVIAVRLPTLDGMVPLSRLESTPLRTHK